MELVLKRNVHNRFGTFGELFADGQRICDTVEQDWENNNPNVSCVPNGVYNLRYFESPLHGPSYILYSLDLNIGRFPGEATRFGCLIHKANLASELRGCIAPGMSLGYYKKQWSVSSSKPAMDKLFSLLGKVDNHSLVICSEFPDFKECG